MNFNLTESSYVDFNTVVGNVSGTYSAARDISALTGSLELSNNDIMCLDFDLGARIELDAINYYFTSSSDTSLVASGIEFLYKNDEIDSYTSLSTIIGAGFYTTSISGISAPRYLRVIHTISGTSVSGTVVGFEMTNDDTTVDFGQDGTATTLALNATTQNVYTTSKYVYNSGTERANAYIKIQPIKSDIDNALYIAPTEEGPWEGPTSNPIMSPDENASETGLFNHPYYDKRGVVSDGRLKVYTDYTEGSFTSRIFDTNKEKFADLNLVYNLPEGTKIAVDADDDSPTIEVRSSNTEPRRYAYYRRYYRNGAYNYAYHCSYNIHWLIDGAVKRRAADSVESPATTNFEYYVSRSVMDTIDSETEYTYLFINQARNQLYYMRYDSTNIGNSATPSLAIQICWYNGSSMNTIPYEVLPDINKGCWLYFYVATITTGYQIPATNGYYLLYFNSNGSRLYTSGTMSTKNIHSCSVVYDTGDLWYTDTVAGSVFKISNTGEFLVTFVPEDENISLGGICATSDGGCWFVNDTSIHKLDTDGNLLDSLEDMNSFGDLGALALEGDVGLWVVDGAYVRNIELASRRSLFDTHIGQPRQFRSAGDNTDGILVHCEDNYNKFINKSTRTITNNHYCELSVPGPFSVSYDNEKFSGKYYYVDDAFWGGSPSASSYQTGTGWDVKYPDWAVNNDENGYWQASSSSIPQWWKYDLGAGRTFKPKIVRVRQYNNFRFYFQGSNNNVDWDDLINYAQPSTTAFSTYYMLTNENSYRYFRCYFFWQQYASPAGIREIEVIGYNPYFPNEADQTWSELSWKKVSLDNYNFSSDKYHQVRITVRRDDTLKDPYINGGYLHKSTDLGTVYPNGNKEFFIKIDAPSDSEEYLGSFSSNIIAWWEIPVE